MNTLPNTSPEVTISSPSTGANFTVGDSINFIGTANDNEDGDLTANLSWSSDLDGVIGSGGSFSTSGLSLGTHTITGSVTDAGSFPGSDVVTITVAANTAPEVTITNPADGASFLVGTSIDFAGTAADAQEGDLTPGLSWSSDLDGAIGSGASSRPS